jgi:hypothetical protein
MEFTRINITPIILRRKIEDRMEILGSARPGGALTRDRTGSREVTVPSQGPSSETRIDSLNVSTGSDQAHSTIIGLNDGCRHSLGHLCFLRFLAHVTFFRHAWEGIAAG